MLYCVCTYWDSVQSLTSDIRKTVETLGDPYRSKTLLPSVPNYQEPDLVHSTPLHRVEWNESMNSYNARTHMYEFILVS